MKKLFNYALTFLLIFVLSASFSLVQAETDGHQEHNNLELRGVYYGFLPCDDCKGVKMTLALNNNNTYILMTTFIGRSEREFVEKGKFSWGESKNTLILTPRKGGTKPSQYFVGENMLIKLDSDGNQYTGELADRYKLHRKDIMTGDAPEHSGH